MQHSNQSDMLCLRARRFESCLARTFLVLPVLVSIIRTLKHFFSHFLPLFLFPCFLSLLISNFTSCSTYYSLLCLFKALCLFWLSCQQYFNIQRGKKRLKKNPSHLQPCLSKPIPHHDFFPFFYLSFIFLLLLALSVILELSRVCRRKTIM